MPPDPGRTAEAEAAVKLWRRGLRPIPLHPIGARVTKPGAGGVGSDGKDPIGTDWAATAYTSERALRRVFRDHPGAGVGLALGLAPDGGPGLVDLEVDDPAAAGPTLAAIFGAAGPPRTAGWRSARGEHRIYALTPDDARRLLDAGITKAVLDGKDHPCLAGLELRLGTLDPACPKQTQSVAPPTVTRNLDGSLSPPRRYVDADAGFLRLPPILLDYLIEHLGRMPEPVTPSDPPDRKGLVGLAPLEKFTAQLEKLGISWSRCSEGHACRCPAHLGDRENLTFVEADDGRLLVYCHRGCTFEEVLAAVNLTPWNVTYADVEDAETTHRPGITNIEVEDREVTTERRAKLALQHARAVALLKAHPERLGQLADRLGVSTEALERLGVGWREDMKRVDGRWEGTGRWAWTFPEVHGGGEIVGLLRRYAHSGPDDAKKLIAGGRRGLTLPSGWEQGAGPIHLVEGASDVAAMLTLGRVAIGRPQARSPRVLRDLVELLKDDGRVILVVADRDEVGLQGARALAAALARRLGPRVRVAVPPRGCKDMRDYLNIFIRNRKGR